MSGVATAAVAPKASIDRRLISSIDSSLNEPCAFARDKTWPKLTACQIARTAIPESRARSASLFAQAVPRRVIGNIDELIAGRSDAGTEDGDDLAVAVANIERGMH